MSIEGEGKRQFALREFTFPNNYPSGLVESEMQRILGHRYVDPLFDFDPEAHMGTKWFISVSYFAEKPKKPIDQMDLVELELEFLALQRLEEDLI